jgi:hypothetical protein
VKLRVLASTIIAASQGETRFKASYKTLVGLLFRHGDGRAFMAKKSEVRRMMGALRRWQESTGITLCRIVQGGKSRNEKGNDEYHETEFELIILEAIAKALERNPTQDKMRAAVRIEIAEMMKLPPFDARWRAADPSVEQTQKRDRKAAITKAIRACEAEGQLHGDPVAYAEKLAAEIIAAARQKFAAESSSDEAAEQSNVANQELERTEGVSDPTHPSNERRSKIAPLKERAKVPNPVEQESREEPSPEAIAAWSKLELRMRGTTTTTSPDT